MNPVGNRHKLFDQKSLRHESVIPGGVNDFSSNLSRLFDKMEFSPCLTWHELEAAAFILYYTMMEKIWFDIRVKRNESLLTALRCKPVTTASVSRASTAHEYPLSNVQPNAMRHTVVDINSVRDTIHLWNLLHLISFKYLMTNVLFSSRENGSASLAPFKTRTNSTRSRDRVGETCFI